MPRGATARLGDGGGSRRGVRAAGGSAACRADAIGVAAAKDERDGHGRARRLGGQLPRPRAPVGRRRCPRVEGGGGVGGVDDGCGCCVVYVVALSEQKSNYGKIRKPNQIKI